MAHATALPHASLLDRLLPELQVIIFSYRTAVDTHLGQGISYTTCPSFFELDEDCNGLWTATYSGPNFSWSRPAYNTLVVQTRRDQVSSGTKASSYVLVYTNESQRRKFVDVRDMFCSYLSTCKMLGLESPRDIAIKRTLMYLDHVVDSILTASTEPWILHFYIYTSLMYLRREEFDDEGTYPDELYEDKIKKGLKTLKSLIKEFCEES